MMTSETLGLPARARARARRPGFKDVFTACVNGARGKERERDDANGRTIRDRSIASVWSGYTLHRMIKVGRANL